MDSSLVFSRMRKFHPSKIAALMLMGLACAWVLALGVSSARYEKLTPDACVYVDMARNLSEGRGMVLRFNLYQSWIGTERKALAYQQPIYPWLTSFLFLSRQPIRAAVIVNAVLAASSLVLLFCAWRRLLPHVEAAMAAASLAFTPMFYQLYSVPLTEMLGLFLPALSIALLFRSGRYSGLAGLIMGISILVRASNIFGVMSFVAAGVILSGVKERRRVIAFSAGAFLPLLLYQALCFLKLGEIYPSYGPDARIFRMTRDFGGAIYQQAAPALRFAGQVGPSILAKMIRYNVLSHLVDMAGAVGWPLLILSAVGTYLGVKEKKSPFIIPLFSFAVGSLVFFSAAFYFMHELEVERYALAVFAFAVPLAVLGLGTLLERWEKTSRWRSPVIAVICLFMAIHGGHKTLEGFRGEAERHGNEEIQRIYFHEPGQWVREAAGQDELVATNYILEACRWDRPVISLPINRQLNENSLARFLAVHQPKALLVDHGNDFQPGWKEPDMRRILIERGYGLKNSNQRFALYLRGPDGG